MNDAERLTGRKTRGALAGVVALGLLFSMTPAAFAEDDASLSLTLSQATGTEPFQSDDNPGNDSGPDNGIIRTNDTITYNLGIRYEGDDHTAPTIDFELPRGQEFVQLPPFCLAGSEVDPAALPAPAAPLTATSWESLPRQAVTCVLKDENMGTALNYAFVARVRSEVPNGTVMDEVTFSVASDQATAPETIAPERATVSAAAKFDVSKRGEAVADTSGPFTQGQSPCSFDSSRACRTMLYPVTVTVPAGGRGTTPLAGPISFEDDLRPESFYGSTVWAAMVADKGGEAAAASAYAPRVAGCYSITSTGTTFRGELPASRIGLNADADEVRSVRDSGTFTCTQVAAGDPATIRIEDADTTAFTTPSKTASGNSLAANLGYVVSFYLRVDVPTDAVTGFGQGGDGVYTLSTFNEFENFDLTALDGTPVAEANPDNNTRRTTLRVEIGSGINKGFIGVFGTDGNTPWTSFDNNQRARFEGVPGAGIWKDGNSVVMPGQSVLSALATDARGIGASGTQHAQTITACDVWDADRLALAAHPDWRGYSAAMYPSNGEPVFPVLVGTGAGMGNNKPASAIDTPDSHIRNVKIEYSSGPAGPGADADCSTGTWSTDPDDIATPTTDALGRTVWEGVNRVRVTYNTDWPAELPTADIGYFHLAIGQVVLASGSAEPIGNWASAAFADGVRDTADEVYANKRKVATPTYDPEGHSGTLGDRLWEGAARVRVAKFVQNPGTGEYTSAAVPQYTSGAAINYRLNPSLNGDSTAASAPQRVIVEDCLPRFQTFTAATQGGNALDPAVQQKGAPAGADIACPADREYLKWDLGELTVGQPIEPIFIEAEILEIARNGTFTNDVTVSSPADTSPRAVRSDDVQMQLVVPTGLKISKTVDPGVIEVNPDGVQTPRTLTWSVLFANIDGPPNVGNVDVIDVLPARGLNGNAFNGTLRFESAAPAAGTTGVTILYTKAPAADLSPAPSHASNLANGSTVWCDALSGGDIVSGGSTDAAADCPQANDEVTGLRFQRAGEFNPDDDFQIDIVTTPVGNKSGDSYRNITSGQADGVTQGVGPARRIAKAIASQVGDFVWNDLNKNGVQDSGEPGVGGVQVALTGTDADGNPVSLDTVTDADGKYLFPELASGEYEVTFDISSVTGYLFTQKGAGSDATVDSNADQSTGKSGTFSLGKDSKNLSIDAGLVQHFGGLVINKQLKGAGVKTIAAQDELVFDVVCTVGADTVFEDRVALAAKGRQAVTSDELKPIPAGAECTVTETVAGTADPDSLPDPVTVTIPWDPQTGRSGTVTASLTNYYSAGQIQLMKKVQGDAKRLAMVKDTEFSFLVTCQVEETGANGDRVVSDLVSRTWRLKGGETIILSLDGRTAMHLPLGARCFGEETDDGGADSATISHDSFENAVVVEGGTPADLQTLEIEAVNVFTCANDACGTTTGGGDDDGDGGGNDPLAVTGGRIGGIVLAAAGMIAVALFLLARRRGNAE